MKEMADIEESFPVLEGTPTNVLKCGKLNSKTSLVVLIIPGNPGVAHYYIEYMTKLHECSKEQLPVWCIGHAGHSKLPANSTQTDHSGELFTLKGQIRHKVLYIKNHIPQGSRLILIGHSIGAYIILHMLDQLQETHKIELCCLLFPTIERLAQSASGKKVTQILSYLYWLPPLVLYLPCLLLPENVVEKVISWYFYGNNVGKYAISATAKVADSSCIKCVFAMANEEMQNVTEADDAIISRHLDKLLFYYGANDHWCPVQYYYDIKKRHSKLDARLCQNGYPHAFVLGASVQMAELTWGWIEEKCIKLS